jgi:hypothetical protein
MRSPSKPFRLNLVRTQQDDKNTVLIDYLAVDR